MKKFNSVISLLILASLWVSAVNFTIAQSGGTFSITESVIGTGGGGQGVSGGTFSVSGTIGQHAVGDNATGGTFNINHGFWVGPTNGVGIEGDVAPRTAGDGSVISNDVVQMRQYSSGTATPDADLGEFQRADSAPKATFGDGMIASNDIVQTRLYQNTPLQQAAGPLFQGGGPLPAPIDDKIHFNDSDRVALPRELRVESTTAQAGMPFTLNIRVDAVGDEAEYGFRVNYESSKLTNPVIGAGNAGSGVRSCNTAVAGVVGCSVGSFPDNQPGSSDAGIGEIHAGNNQIMITVTFNVLASAAAGPSPLTLTNVNASNDSANLVPMSATNGNVNISSATAAQVSVSGRVTTGDGRGIRNVRVTLTDQSGIVRTALTGAFGYYRFDEIEAGQTVILSIAAKRYVFANPARVVAVLDELADVDFIAEP